MKLRIAMDLFLIVLFFSVLFIGYGLAENGSVMPLLIGIVGSALSVWQLWADVHRFDDSDIPLLSRVDCRQLIWIACLFLIVIALGFLPCAPLWMFFYLRWGREENWSLCFALSLAIYGLLWLGFDIGMGVSLFPGLLRM